MGNIVFFGTTVPSQGARTFVLATKAAGWGDLWLYQDGEGYLQQRGTPYGKVTLRPSANRPGFHLVEVGAITRDRLPEALRRESPSYSMFMAYMQQHAKS